MPDILIPEDLRQRAAEESIRWTENEILKAMRVPEFLKNYYGKIVPVTVIDLREHGPRRFVVTYVKTGTDFEQETPVSEFEIKDMTLRQLEAYIARRNQAMNRDNSMSASFWMQAEMMHRLNIIADKEYVRARIMGDW